MSTLILTLSGPPFGGNSADLLYRESGLAGAFEYIEDVGNVAGSTCCPDLNPAVRQHVHLDLVAGGDAEMPEQFLPQGHLKFYSAAFCAASPATRVRVRMVTNSSAAVG